MDPVLTGIDALPIIAAAIWATLERSALLLSFGTAIALAMATWAGRSPLGHRDNPRHRTASDGADTPTDAKPEHLVRTASAQPLAPARARRDIFEPVEIARTDGGTELVYVAAAPSLPWQDDQTGKRFIVAVRMYDRVLHRRW